MCSKLNFKTLAQLATILLIAFALKYHYSTASVNELRWILAPTAVLVEWITGQGFAFESHAGYMSSDHTFLIAAPCAGVNFFIIAFLILALGRIRRGIVEWRFIPSAIVAAYFATLMANTTRIVVALKTRGMETAWLDGEQLHRFEGIVVYFGFLLVPILLSESLASRVTDFRVTASAIISRLKLLLVIYYGVTLGIPLVRGSYLEPEFWHHMLFVTLIPFALILPFAIVAVAVRRSQPESLP